MSLSLTQFSDYNETVLCINDHLVLSNKPTWYYHTKVKSESQFSPIFHIFENEC